MYKIIIIIYFFVSTLSACEFVNGVTITDPQVSVLFNKVSTMYAQDGDTSKHIEDLYIQYLCLIAQRGERDAFSYGGGLIVEQIKGLIAALSKM